MAGIPTEFINQVLDRIDIIDVIAPRVSLKKAGKDYQALCPFHDDHNPSFSVNEEENYWYCFACDKGGSVIDFWMMKRGCDFTKAVQDLAEKLL